MSVNTYLAPSPVIPPFLLISNITRASQAVITVTESNNYIVGQLVYLSIPSSYGMVQANSLTVEIVAVSSLNFTVNMNSLQFDTFVTPATYQPQPASLAPAGCRNIYNIQYVPFHSEGNFGN